MDTTITLTATEVIDRVREARDDEHEAAVDSSTSPSTGLSCTPAETSTRPAGRTTTASSPPVHPWPVRVRRWSMSSHPPPSPPPSASPWRPPSSCSPTPSSSPTDSPACSTSSNAGSCRCGEPARSPGRPTTCRSRRSRSRTGSSAPPRRRSAWSTPPGWSQEARLYFDPDRAIADEEHELARRGVWLRHRGNPATTDVVMTLDTPDALLVRPDRRPHRRRTRRTSATPTRSTSAEHGRSGSSPTPSTPSTSCPAATQRRPRRRWCGEPLRPPRPRPARCRRPSRSSAPPPPTCSNDWLTRYAAAGGKVIVRPVLDLDSTTTRWTSTTHPARCGSSACCATPTASSPAAAETPGAATSTTSSPTSP